MLRGFCSILLSFILAVSPGIAYARGKSDEAAHKEEAKAMLDGSVEDIVASMTLQEKISQMIMISCRTWDDDGLTDLDAAPGLAAALRKHPYGGIILFGPNVVGNEQVAQLIEQLQANNRKAATSTVIPYFMATDQEGGIVTRLSAGTRMTGSMAIGATADAAANAELTGDIIGEELAALGFNVDFAPDADVNSNPANPVIGTRSFSDDPNKVSELASFFAKGLAKHDVIGTYKHFPGHGDSGNDTHIDTATVDKTLDELYEAELVPFRSVIGSGAEMIMTAHITLPSYDDPVTFANGMQGTYPATMSRKVVTDLLRGELGYDGVVITDALEMDAIDKAALVEGDSGSVEYRANIAEKIINAGVDMLLMPADLKDDSVAEFYDGYLAALEEKVTSGAISEKRINESVTRILRLKAAHGFLSEAKPAGDVSVVGSAQHHVQEMKMAREAITLVKNDTQTLPVSGQGKSIVLIGRTSGDATAIEHAVKDLQKMNLIPDDAYVRNLVSGSARGTETSSTRITIDYTYEADPAGVHYSDELKATIVEADLVAAFAKTYTLSALASGAPQYEAVHQPLTDTHAAGGRFVLISNNLPYDAARYRDADAILLAYMGTGTDLDPTSRRDGSTNVGAFNANVIAAVEAMFDCEPPVGTLPVTIPVVQEAEDGTLSYAKTSLYSCGYGLRYTYKFTDGMDGTYIKGTSGGLSFTANARRDRLASVLVDGYELQPESFTAAASPTVITLSEDYLNALGEGVHTLTAHYLYESGNDVDVETSFTVAAPAGKKAK